MYPPSIVQFYDSDAVSQPADGAIYVLSDYFTLLLQVRDTQADHQRAAKDQQPPSSR